MDIFRMENLLGSSFPIIHGEIINEIQEVLWVERYRENGEFKIKGLVSSGLREKLPRKSLISHTGTTELMMVEDHEIEDSEDENSVITITGTSFETFLNNRIVGLDPGNMSGIPVNYELASHVSWMQAIQMLDDHIRQNVDDPDNELPHLLAVSSIESFDFEEMARSVERGGLHTRLMELLAFDDLGVKIIRPGDKSEEFGLDPYSQTGLVIHQGVDRSKEVAFSYHDGEIKKANYFWSDRSYKNAVYSAGRWVQTFYDTSTSGFDRKIMYLDASDIDGSVSEEPTGFEKIAIAAQMQARAKMILSAQKEKALANVEVSDATYSAEYRRDYEVGDIVGVTGNYNESGLMRITEFAEIEDENGQSGYPTLSVI